MKSEKYLTYPFSPYSDRVDNYRSSFFHNVCVSPDSYKSLELVLVRF
ncbi:hypothetical protein [Tolypothrix sp. VBCCA 56010]